MSFISFYMYCDNFKLTCPIWWQFINICKLSWNKCMIHDFLKATKPSKCLLSYHSVSIGQFLFQNIGVEVDIWSVCGCWDVESLLFLKIVFPQVGKRSHVGQVAHVIISKKITFTIHVCSSILTEDKIKQLQI